MTIGCGEQGWFGLCLGGIERGSCSSSIAIVLGVRGLATFVFFELVYSR